MTEFVIARRQGLLIGGAIALAILIADALCIYQIRALPISLASFLLNLWLLVSLGALALLGSWLWNLGHAGYALDRNQLVINWGFERQVIPMNAITQAVDGTEVQGALRVRALTWPGYLVGPGETPGLGLTLFFATRPKAELVFLVTPAVTYAVSPQDKAGFIDAFTVRHRMGVTQAVEQQSFGPRWLQWPLWGDRVAVALIALTGLVNLVLFGYLCYRMPDLPAQVALHFDTLGGVDRWGAPPELFILPFIGLIAWVVNGLGGGLLHMRWQERPAAYLLWSASLLVQMLLWFVMLDLLGVSYVA